MTKRASALVQLLQKIDGDKSRIEAAYDRCRPVIIAAREGEQYGLLEYAWVKRMP